jgi:hypothetical protein
MIETLHIPILLKAIDFVFDEGRKILEERRERRKSQETPATESQQQEAEQAVNEEVQAKEEVKQDLLAAKIDESRWKNHEAEVQHLVRLLETYSRNYQLSKEQYAKWGSALVPPIIVSNMTEAENAMLETIKKLEDALSKVYEKDITPQQ